MSVTLIHAIGRQLLVNTDEGRGTKFIEQAGSLHRHPLLFYFIFGGLRTLVHEDQEICILLGLHLCV